MKKILSFGLFEAVYLGDINPFKKDKNYVGGLKFSNKENALASVKRVQSLLDNKEIELKDAIIASYIMSKRAESHKSKNPGIKEGGKIWEEYLNHLKAKENS